MKKMIASLMVLLMLSVLLTGAATSEGNDGGSSSLPTAQVTTEKGFLNLRGKPEEGSSVLGHIPNGSMVTVISQGDVFWEVQYNDLQGYAMCKFLTLVDSTTDDSSGDASTADVTSGDASTDVSSSGDTPSGEVSADNPDSEEPAPETTMVPSSLEQSSAEQAPAGSVAQVTTEQGPLNLRKEPQDDATILEKIPNRSLVSVVSREGTFWEVQYGDVQGYAMCEYLTMTDLSPDALDYRVLYRGNTGDDVLALKNRLLELGYYRSGSSMNNNYNETCVERLKMFQEQNGLNVDGVASAAVQAKLFSADATVNTKDLPAPISSGYVIASASSSSSSVDDPGAADFDWNQWMLAHPGVCPCCMGKGCACCNWTGKI